MKKTLLSFILLSTVSLTAFAQCKETYAGSFTQSVATGYVAGQSFTAPCSGKLNYVQFTSDSAGTVPAGTLNIYAGNGTGTTPIYTQAFSAFTVANIGDPIRINVTGNVPITNASQYTFAFHVNLKVLASISGYTGGDAFQAGTNVSPVDVDFEADIAASTGIDEITNTTATIYPNPANNVLNITTNEQVKLVSIFAINGELVKTATQKNIDISELTNGMYIVSVQTNNGITQTKIIKE